MKSIAQVVEDGDVSQLRRRQHEIPSYYKAHAGDRYDMLTFNAALSNDSEMLRILYDNGVWFGFVAITTCICNSNWDGLDYLLEIAKNRGRILWMPFDFLYNTLSDECITHMKVAFDLDKLKHYYRMNKAQWDSVACSSSGRRD